jgi:hypothetical protein
MIRAIFGFVFWTHLPMTWAAAVVGVASCLHIWTVWYCGTICTVGTDGSLWSALAELPDNMTVYEPASIWHMQTGNMVTAGIVGAIAVGGGLLIAYGQAKVRALAESLLTK